MKLKILDRYIIRTFLINFAILTMVMLSLFVLVDLIVDLDEFLDAGEAHAEQWGGRSIATLWVVISYYGPMVPLLYTYFCGLLVVAAMGFTLSAMQRSRELIAVVASGVSLFRVAAPILVVGIALNALVIPVQELVVPPLIEELSRSKSALDDTGTLLAPVYYAVDEHGHLLSAGNLDAARGRLENAAILQRDARGMATRRISATRALWDAEQQRWRLIAGQAVEPSLEETAPEARREALPIAYFQTQLSPTVLRAQQEAVTMRLLSLSSLQALSTNEAMNPAERAQITQVIWSRFSMMVVNVLVLVMALPLFLVKQPVHFVGQAAKAAALAIGSWGGALMTVQVSTTALNPVASAWLPVVVFLPLSVWLMQRVRS